jgi:hypothetical protein
MLILGALLLLSGLGEALGIWRAWNALRIGQWSVWEKPLRRTASPALFWTLTVMTLLSLCFWPVAAALLLTRS